MCVEVVTKNEVLWIMAPYFFVDGN